MGIVYSSRLENVPEQLLYTSQNYFTGTLSPCPSLYIRTKKNLGRIRIVLGRTDRGLVQSSLRYLRWYHGIDRSTC